MDLQKTPTKLFACLLLGALGFIGNWFKIELFSNVDFLLGSFFVMLAIMMLGGVYGVITGFVAASCTYFLWNHPWAIIPMTGEALFVAWLFQRRIRNLLICDMLYWLLLGAPMVYVFFHHTMHVQLQLTVFIMLKQSINGIFNALLACIIYGIIQTRGDRRGWLTPFRDLLFIVMATLVLFPALLFFLIGLKEEHQQEMFHLAAKVAYRTDMTRESISSWIDEHRQNVQTLVRLIEDPDSVPMAQMQRLVEIIKAASPAFLRMGVMDRRGISIAYSPSQDGTGVSTIGLDFSDRPYVPIIRETKQPYVSDVVMGRTNPVAPILPVVAPFIAGNEYKGFCGGVVDLASVNKMLAVLAHGNEVQITVLDRNRKVIATTRTDLKVMEEFHRPRGSTEPVDGVAVHHWMPEARAGIPTMQRWRESLLIEEQTVSPGLSWVVIVEGPVLPVLQSLTALSIRALTLLGIFVTLTVLLTHLASRTLTRRLSDLQEVTNALPSHLSDVSRINWPDSRIGEVNQLVGNFRQMASALAASFHEQEILNESLETAAGVDLLNTRQPKQQAPYFHHVMISVHGRQFECKCLHSAPSFYFLHD